MICKVVHDLRDNVQLLSKLCRAGATKFAIQLRRTETALEKMHERQHHVHATLQLYRMGFRGMRVWVKDLNGMAERVGEERGLGLRMEEERVVKGLCEYQSVRVSEAEERVVKFLRKQAAKSRELGC